MAPDLTAGGRAAIGRLLLAMSLIAMAPSGALAENAADLTDAEGIPEEPTVAPHAAEDRAWLTDVCQHRGHVKPALAEAAMDRERGRRGPDLYLALAGQCAALKSVQVFMDGRIVWREEDDARPAVLDQGGVRVRPVDNFELAMGRERNRRAPGLVVAPSDFIHSDAAMPGTEENRAGEWLARGSLQVIGTTVDVMALPVDRLRDNGLPAEDSRYRGTVARFFRQFDNLDLNLAFGRVDDEGYKAGLSSQGFLTDAWRIYGEGRYEERRRFLTLWRERVPSLLLGTGYDGDVISWRVEGYHHGAGLSDEEFTVLMDRLNTRPPVGVPSDPREMIGSAMPFLRRQYLLGSVSLLEIQDVVNLRQTLIFGTEDGALISHSRADWLAGTRTVVGAGYQRFVSQGEDQLVLRPYDWELTGDVKVSF